MATVKEFIRDYANISFDDKPLCDGDFTLICQAFYMPLEFVVSDSLESEPMALSEACRRVMEMQGNKHKKLGLMITKAPSQRLQDMATSWRYKDVKVLSVKAVFTRTPAVQYAAGSFLMPDGTVIISFRGTDDSIAGWKEDLDFFVKHGSPAYDYAVEYVESVAAKYDGDIALCGHSKGGNEALYAALNCSEETRKRIKYLFNADGPGYYSHSVIEGEEYNEILPNYLHYVPSSSFIGVMLAHDYDYKSIRSSKHLGPLQHDLGTWQISDGSLEVLPDTDILSKITDVCLAKIADKAQNGGYNDVVENVIDRITLATDQLTLADFAAHAPSSLKKAVKEWKDIDFSSRSEFSKAFKGAGKLLKESIKIAKEGKTREVTSELLK